MGDNLIQVNWDSHKQILFGNLSALRDEQIHTDVTLFCEGNFYPAHKLVLTMCSEYFAKAFQYAVNSSPIFFLCGIKKETLEALLSFIYNGTVTIPSEEVDEMVKAGNILQIQELSQIASVISNKVGSPFSDDVTIQQNSPASKKLEPMVILEKNVIDRIIKKRADTCEKKENNAEDAEGQENSTYIGAPIKEENLFDGSRDGSSSDYTFEGWDSPSVKQAKAKACSLISVISEKNSSRKSKLCFKCKHEFSCQSELVAHFISKHKNLMRKHYCLQCKKIFTFKKSFLKHQKLLNCGRKFCKKCRYSSLSFDDFRAHLRNHWNEENAVNGVNSVESKVALMAEFGVSQKKKRKFSNKALNDALRAISSDFQNFTNVGTCFDECDRDYSSSVENLQEKSFNCMCCQMNFDDSIQLNRHKQIDCKLLECPFCLKVFIKEKKDLLEKHKRNHDLVSKPYSCPYCTFICDEQLIRDNHLDKHTRKD